MPYTLRILTHLRKILPKQQKEDGRLLTSVRLRRGYLNQNVETLFSRRDVVK